MAPPVGPYTPAYRAGDFLFVSGQLGLQGDHLPDGMHDQAKQALTNLKALLEENGASLDKVVKTTVFLTEIAAYAHMNEIYAEFFGDHKPARSAVAVHQLPKAALIEIEAVAYLG